MELTIALGVTAALSIALLAWQVLAAARFPLHCRSNEASFTPPVVLLKPLKGVDEFTADCLRSWLRQEYRGEWRVLFGVAHAEDPACDLVRTVLREFPSVSAELVLTDELLGTNAKVSNLIHLFNRAKSELKPDTIICVSDADVRVPPGFLATSVEPLVTKNVGLVTSFYQLANPVTFPMRVEAAAVNGDFWSQVLQSNTIRPQAFALGAVMFVRSNLLQNIGGFDALAEYLAEDYELGRRVAEAGASIALTTIPAECWDPPHGWRQVWTHQLRWGRTIRVSQPVPYFFSLLSNVSLWTTAFAVSGASMGIYRIAPGYPLVVDGLWIACCAAVWGCVLLARTAAGQHLAARMTQRSGTWKDAAAILVRDWLQLAIWVGAFVGNSVTWRGNKFRVTSEGKLVRLSRS